MNTRSASNLLCSGKGSQLHCLVSLNSVKGVVFFMLSVNV